MKIADIKTELRPGRQVKTVAAVKNGLLAFVDQGLISGSNFILSAVLARKLTESDYGIYALGFSIFILASFAHQALVLEPLSVFGPSQTFCGTRQYLGVMLRGHLLLSFVAMGLSATLAVVTWTLGAKAVAMALLGVFLCAPCVLLFWLTRRCFYMRFSPGSAAIGAFVYSALMFAGIGLLAVFNRLSPFTAFGAMAGAALITGFKQLRELKPALRYLPWRPILVQHWNYGKWALVTCLLTWLPANVYYSFLGWFSNVSAAASLKAIQNLTAPMSQAQTALTLLFLPYAAHKLHEHGVGATARDSLRISVLFVSAALVYWGLILCFPSETTHLLYGNKYQEVVPWIPWMAASSCINAAAQGAAIALRSMGRSRTVFQIACFPAGVTLLLGPAAAWRFGVQGAITVQLLSSSAAFFAGLWLLRRRVADSNPNSEDTASIDNTLANAQL
jgi:O-antigen/teichoic acid export membrane protein